MNKVLREVDKVEILTLQDNYVDVTTRDNTEVVLRAMPLKDMQVKNSFLAEHGFSAVVTVTSDDDPRSILFDFGFSAHGAAFNADALGVDLTKIEACVVSHGHRDHVGGMEQLADKIGTKGTPLVVHPEAFRNPRYLKVTDQFKVFFPPLTKEQVNAAGLTLAATAQPHGLLDDAILFLGEVPRRTPFEKVGPDFCYEKDGREVWDDIIDDSAVAVNLKGKGLVVLSGCAHAGIINTLRYAQEITGQKKIHAVMGGFHLNGADAAAVVNPTIEGLIDADPAYVIPTHCTGRKEVMEIERRMPDRFLLNMVGTKMTFSA
jgi:7,8-dihydropterin-6-yl-methyl-4-(beta-D-ribofuranosyl)aminobenzene 5'-phosphate synthase